MMLATAEGVVWACMLATAAAPSAAPAIVAPTTQASAVKPVEPIAPIAPLAPLTTLAPVDQPRPPGAPDHRDLEFPTPLRRERHVRLALTEATLGLVAGMGWYYAHTRHNEYDVDYTWSAETFKKKLITFDAVRFDDNAFYTNTISHPLAATGWYLIFRGNRLTPLESFLLTLAYSTFWELMVEYREVASINDLIATPMGGLTLGEPMVQTSAFLRAGSPGLAGRTVAAVLNPFEAINSALEGTPSDGEQPSDRYGIAVAYPHRLEVSLGYGNTSFAGDVTRNELVIGARAEVDTRADLPGPGRDHRLVGPGALSRIGLDFAVTNDDGAGLDEVDVATKVSLLGGLVRAADGPNEVSVSSSRRFFYGLGSGFEYADRKRPNQFEDLLGISKLIGPMLDWRFTSRSVQVHLSADAFYDFAAITSSGLPAYVAGDAFVGLPSVVTLHGYYYAQGVSASARAIVDVGRWELGGAVLEDDFWWFQARDRFPGVGPEPSAWDRRFSVWGHAAVRPLARQPIKLTLRGGRQVREGSMGGAQAETSELRMTGLAGVQF